MAGNKLIRESVIGMFVYFGKRPQEVIIDMYEDAMAAFNTEYVVLTCKHFITNADKLPKIVDLANYIRSTWEISEHKEWDPEYDPTYPLDRLWSAYYLLVNNKGNMQAFHNYCEKHQMPRQDRDGVLGKYCHTYRIDRKELLNGWHHLYKG